MNWLDALIALFLATSLARGIEVGFIRQFFSTVGFFVGIFIGAWLQGLIIHLAGTPSARTVVMLLITLGFALTFMTLGEYVGITLKTRLKKARLTNKIDKIFGAGMAGATLLIAIWLSAAIFRNMPDTTWQKQIHASSVITFLDNNLPSAPGVLTKLGHLIDPNGFPQVFSGLEPQLKTDAPLPEMGDLNAAVQQVRPSVVKVEGDACNAVVEGTGFITAPGQIVTNAHVVAGVKKPWIVDQKGRHAAIVTAFNPELDMAVLQVEGLTGAPLLFETERAPFNTPVAALGYPSGAGFTAVPGVVMESFTARGRNIYNQGSTTRQVYSVKTDIRQGNSGGPIINKDAKVLGLVFAKSINYDQIGYALTTDQVLAELANAKGKTASVSTKGCAE